jgi:hypothetical protein
MALKQFKAENIQPFPRHWREANLHGLALLLVALRCLTL